MIRTNMDGTPAGRPFRYARVHEPHACACVYMYMYMYM